MIQGTRDILDELNWIGVNRLVKQFQQPFDSEKVAAIVAEREGTTPEAILSDWEIKRKMSAARGKIVHSFIENTLSCGEAKPGSVPQDYASYCYSWIRWYNDNRYLYHFTKPEHQVSSAAAGLIGVIDQVAFNQSNSSISIIDWKTGSKFTTESNKMMLPPFDHLQDCHLVEYSLVMHIYKDLHRIQNTIRPEKVYNLFCVHLTPQGWHHYDCLPLHDEAKQLFSMRLKH